VLTQQQSEHTGNRAPFQGQGTYLCTFKETADANNREDFVNYKYPLSTVEMQTVFKKRKNCTM